MIFMAKGIDQAQASLGIMDIVVQRNAFGRQVDSFQCKLDIPVLHQYKPAPFPAVFIRAPRLTAVKGHAKLLACLPDGSGVAAREGQWLVSAFHPELTDDDRFHRYFLSLITETP
jgi:5'-phosphate synthase pdxT subunit